MDALKKAEEAKRLASEGNTPENPAAKQELRLEPVITPATKTAPPPQNQPRSQSTSQPNSPLPDLSMHIDSVDADLAAVSTEAPVKRRSPSTHTPPPARSADTSNRETAERMAVRNAFAAKQPTKSRTGLALLLGLGGITILGIGAYFWWQLQAVAVGSLARSAPPMLPSQQTLQPLTPAAPIQTPPPATAEIMQTTQDAAPQAAAALPPTRANGDGVRAQRAPAAANQNVPESPVRLSRSQPKTNQILERAYDTLQTGQLDRAQVDYEQVLRSDPKNTDALLGLATIAARQGQAEQAQSFYLRALESDPNDATAQAGVLNTRGQADPGLSESRLKTALANQPTSPALHFALGNLYARQQRWSEAQQAYFRAYSSEPDNADFIFNLAVSLDHLHQNKLAAQYYQMALNASAANNSRAFAFDRNQVKTRVLELKP